MDTFKFYDITHREHVVCNPTSVEKLKRLVELVRLPKDAKVVDIACGKGEFVIRLDEAYGIRGEGIDISPFYIAEAKSRLEKRASKERIVFTQMNGADYKPEELHKLDLASCIGASWVFGGHAETLGKLTSMVKPGGWVIVGEPYWLKEPSEDYLEALGFSREEFGSHSSNAEAGEQQGLNLVHSLVSNKDDWDTYEGLQWYATAEYARTHSDDPDLAELVRRVENDKSSYLRWGRDTLGWAIYLFRRRMSRVPGDRSPD